MGRLRISQKTDAFTFFPTICAEPPNAPGNSPQNSTVPNGDDWQGFGMIWVNIRVYSRRKSMLQLKGLKCILKQKQGWIIQLQARSKRFSGFRFPAGYWLI